MNNKKGQKMQIKMFNNLNNKQIENQILLYGLGSKIQNLPFKSFLNTYNLKITEFKEVYKYYYKIKS